MAVTVVSCEEDYSARSSDWAEDGTRKCERRFIVLLNVFDQDAAARATVESIAEGAVPVALYDPHPAYSWCRARTAKVTNAGSHDRWYVTVGYSSAPFPALGDGTGGSVTGSGGGPSSPSQSGNNNAAADARPPEICIRRAEYTHVLERDVIDPDKAVVNAAGDPFDPPVEVTRSRLVYEISFYRTPAAFDWSSRSSFMDRVNSASFSLGGVSHAAKTLRVRDITHEGQWDKNGSGALSFFWKITVAVEYKPDTWVIKVLNAGRRQKLGSEMTGFSVEPIPASTGQKTGETVTDPVPLDAAGKLLPLGDPYVYLEFDGYQTADFSTLFA